jgi:alpha-tubulin suppressor-like RCC1 family protein
VANLVDVVAIAADFGHSLALTKDNIVWGWGQNDYGQLGDGTTDDHSKPMQVVPAINKSEHSFTGRRASGKRDSEHSCNDRATYL